MRYGGHLVRPSEAVRDVVNRISEYVHWDVVAVTQNEAAVGTGTGHGCCRCHSPLSWSWSSSLSQWEVGQVAIHCGQQGRYLSK